MLNFDGDAGSTAGWRNAREREERQTLHTPEIRDLILQVCP